MSKRLAILGSTGSIGVQSLDVAREQGYQVVALAAGSNVQLLAQQVAAFSPDFVALRDESQKDTLVSALAGLPRQPRLLFGPEAAAVAGVESGADIVLNAIVGIAGLSATLAAAKAGVDIALANKESLVTGGALVMQAVKRAGVHLLPVDSEHSAIFQCLQDPFARPALEKILLTASGGPFYCHSKQQLAKVTAKDALAHPNWDMGAKITIDSATLMNKGLELIEAMWLFDVRPDKIQIVVQRESIIHSMVELLDGSVLAQLGVPDMRIPIQYALTWPQRLPGCARRLDFTQLSALSFGVADDETFRCLAACKRAAEIGGLAPCAVNCANEEAVGLFLKGEIGFLDIGRLVEGCLAQNSYGGDYSIEEVYECDAWARSYVRSAMKGQ